MPTANLPVLDPAPRPLTELAPGCCGRLHDCLLLSEEAKLLAALGLGTGCRFRVCRAGDPWILEVKATRIGLADTVAARLMVLPEPVG
ncbi:MAG TPA: FeoA family protein [Thermoanaerobaculia bacterium]|nr:FeoA family protein [Thermoanaerobaculia bacterium]